MSHTILIFFIIFFCASSVAVAYIREKKILRSFYNLHNELFPQLQLLPFYYSLPPYYMDIFLKQFLLRVFFFGFSLLFFLSMLQLFIVLSLALVSNYKMYEYRATCSHLFSVFIWHVVSQFFVFYFNKSVCNCCLLLFSFFTFASCAFFSHHTILPL